MASPSDYANGFSIEHDKMVNEVYDFLKSKPIPETMEIRGEQETIRRVFLEVEYLLSVRGAPRGFVDIVDCLEVTSGGRQGDYLITGYEIKPKLTTVGGLVRQMKASSLLFQAANSGRYCRVRMIPVVRADDPHVGILRQMWPGYVCLWPEAAAS